MNSFKPVQNYDGLSPQTTKGDLAVYGASGSSRLAVGADGTVPTADSSNALGISYQVPTPGLNVFTLTGATTLVNSGTLIEVSGTTFAVTMPNAALHTGKQISIIKTDTGFITPISVIGITTSQVLGLTLSTFQERFDFYSSGTTWKVRQHSWDQSPVTIGISVFATTTPPTLGTSILANNYTVSRIGANIAKFDLFFAQNSTNGAASGTGDYQYALGPLIVDMTNIVGYTTVVGNAAQIKPTNSVGYGSYSAASDSGIITMAMYSATLVRAFFVTSSNSGAVCSANGTPTAASLCWNFTWFVPIKGWTP